MEFTYLYVLPLTVHVQSNNSLCWCCVQIPIYIHSVLFGCQYHLTCQAIPPLRDFENNHIWSIVSHAFNLPPLIITPDDGNPAPLADLRLFHPYLVSRTEVRVDPPPPVSFVYCRTQIPTLPCCSSRSASSSPPPPTQHDIELCEL